MPKKLNFSTTGYLPSENPININGTFGFRIKTGDALSIIPSVMVRYTAPTPYTIDGNIRFVMYDRVWGGLSYRRDDAIVLVAGASITSFMNVTYSYDYSLNSVGKVSNGGHELVLGTLINNRRKILSPEQLW
jgi:type IX secretion system PorP/SprF family membrane protein